MLINQRDAAAVLRAGIHRPTRRLAFGLLTSGFAGPATPVGSQLLYDAEVVAALATAAPVERSHVPDSCRPGVLVLRMSARTGIALEDDAARRAAAQEQCRLSTITAVELAVQRETWGVVPVVATIAGHVLVAAELARGPGGLVLEPGGEWTTAFTGRVLTTPPGNPSVLWKPPRDSDSRPVAPSPYPCGTGV